ncbi:hypothetical protein B9T31_00345 [Acinetobacter sp. ANC 4558]|uniref:hypothetical protein n=1 Tax=Acinetobacter sp. ANC 4558 TaxID=1977876 RepID=UPI000A347B63|nr:hypothetical protein [Acinetobacter sp. ANC 4558]OTG88012.1 hypothetical protein B9T31_00345 [Acinetobacter sp. ANC 4558]
MRLKYLSFCLLSLSLVGCAHHTVNNLKTSDFLLEQRAVNGLNAILETPSFDYKGEFLVQSVTPKTALGTKKPQQKNQIPVLDAELDRKINQVLQNQKISLTAQEKQVLYTRLAEQANPYEYISSYGTGDTKIQKFISGLLNVLNDFKFSYDGSVHYRQKIGSLNLNFEYEKPTLLVKAKVPMVLDFKNNRFYGNFSGFMPFLLNNESQNSFTYFDFSKYKDDISKVNIQAWANYIKQTNALPYILAQSSDIQSIALSQQEKEKGLSEKIRLNTNFESLVLQNMLFEYVNKTYMSETILGETLKETQIEDKSSPTEVYEYYDVDLTEKARASSRRVTEQINHHLAQYGYGVAETCDERCADVEEDEDVTTTDINLVKAVGISEEACTALINIKQKIPFGTVNDCYVNYDIQLLKPQDKKENNNRSILDESSILSFIPKFVAISAIFEPYQSSQFVDAEAFKNIWNKHQLEIQDILNQQKMDSIPITVDLSLDAQGRMTDVVYNIVKNDKKYGNIHILSTTQIYNYGKATPINQQLLKDAKTFKEATKGSAYEEIVGRIFDDSEENTKEVTQNFNQILEQIASDTYKRTGSYVKSYQAVYALYFITEKPNLAKYYSTADLNEIAEVSAYHFNKALRPTAVEKARLEKLVKKHELKQSDNFGEEGYAVFRIMKQVLENNEKQRYWTKLNVKAKTGQSAFAAHYEKLYKDYYQVSSAEDSKQLRETAQILAQGFSDDLKGKLSEKSIQKLKIDHVDYLDPGVYQETYIDIQENIK